MLWTDIATWVGPTTARNSGVMANPPRGLVLHIASGFYDGTISWQKRSSGSDRTSSHFIVGRDGRCAQMVDTADGSWAQKSGNSTWLSIELEGFAPDDGLHATHPGWETATPQQVEVCARLLAKAHQVYGVPLQLATSPSGRGLGHHSMGAEAGVDWGHSACPGTAIKNQKPAILARAVALANGGDDMANAAEINASRNGFAAVQLQPKYKVIGGDVDGGAEVEVGNPLAAALQRMEAKADAALKALGVAQADIDELQARPAADVASLAAALAPLLNHEGVEVTAEQLGAALVTALSSDAGQAALVQAANKAEDS